MALQHFANLMTGGSPKVFGESANGFASFDQPPDGIWEPAEHFIKMIRSASRRVSGLRGQTLARRCGEASLRNTGGVCGTTIKGPDRSHDRYNYNARRHRRSAINNRNVIARGLAGDKFAATRSNFSA
jgi:hypothetical protein